MVWMEVGWRFDGGLMEVGWKPSGSLKNGMEIWIESVK
jgi:hypothetical protein